MNLEAILEKNQIKHGIEVSEAYLTSLKEDIEEMVGEVIGENKKYMTGRQFSNSEKFLKNAAIKIENDLRNEQRKRSQSYLKGGDK